MQVVQFKDKTAVSAADVLAAWKREGGRMPIGAALPMNGKWEGQQPLPMAGAVVKGNPAKMEKRQQQAAGLQFAHRYLPKPDRVMF